MKPGDTVTHDPAFLERARLQDKLTEVTRERDEALSVIRELRQKLAIVGVEGSPPLGEEMTIGALTARMCRAEAELVALRVGLAQLSVDVVTDLPF